MRCSSWHRIQYILTAGCKKKKKTPREAKYNKEAVRRCRSAAVVALVCPTVPNNSSVPVEEGHTNYWARADVGYPSVQAELRTICATDGFNIAPSNLWISSIIWGSWVWPALPGCSTWMTMPALRFGWNETENEQSSCRKCINDS